MSRPQRERPVPEQALINRLRRVLGRDMTQSDVDFLHVLAHPDVMYFTYAYLLHKERDSEGGT